MSATTSSPWPVYSEDRKEVDVGWVRERLGVECERAEVEDISQATAPWTCLRVRLIGATVPTVVIKQVLADNGKAETSRNLGLAREALFYGSVDSTLAAVVPRVYYAHGDLGSGAKVVIMEDLAGYLDSGILFGPGNPSNWSRDLPALAARCGSPPPSAAAVASLTFRAAAAVHARYWRDEQLLDHAWLRGATWVQARGRETWEAAQDMVRAGWAKALAEPPGGPLETVSPPVRALLEKAVAGISWDAQCQRLGADTPWTLVHGDFWPGNVLLECQPPAGAAAGVKLVDWEMVGIGSAPQELGQYVISNMDPAERKASEEQLVREYYDELVQHGVKNFTYEQCWAEYTIGGAERWLWFLVYFLGMGKPMASWTKFFHDQILAFVTDHNITVKDITQPRP